ENKELYDENEDLNVKNNTQHKIINGLTKKISNLSIENHQLKKEYENFKAQIKNLKNYSDILNDILAQQRFSYRCEVKINNYSVMAKIDSGCDGYSSISKEQATKFSLKIYKTYENSYNYSASEHKMKNLDEIQTIIQF
ncbi:10667_t:CDS:1, partial [Gigaspora margarita]